jgi:hypothetical protein
VTQSADKRYKDEIKPFKRDNQTGTLFATCALGFRLCLCAQPALQTLPSRYSGKRKGLQSRP